MHQPLPAQPRERFGLLFILLGTLLVRVAFICSSWDSLQDDPDAYRAIAETLRRTGNFSSTGAPTAFRPPLYPLLLAAMSPGGRLAPIAVAALHVLLGLGTVVATWGLAETWGLSRGKYLVSGLVAIDPILLHQSTLVMTETLATFLATVGLLALARLCTRPSCLLAVSAGVTLALAALTRPTFLPWLGLCCVALPLILRRDPRRYWYATTFAVAATVCLAPWIVRNQLVFGHWKATTTHGGYTLLLGNNPGFYQYLRKDSLGEPWPASELDAVWTRRHVARDANDPILDFDTFVSSEELDRRPRIQRDEFAEDQLAYELARRYIRAEPDMFAYSCLVRVRSLWQLRPQPTTPEESTVRYVVRTLVGIWYLALWVLVGLGLYSRRRELLASPMIWGLLLCLTFTAVHAVYWSNMRMRAPLMPFLCLLAAQGAISVASLVRRKG